MTYYYISSNDPNPRNFSCKRFIIDEECNWICGNNEGSTWWTILEDKYGWDGACQHLIDYYEEHIHDDDIYQGTGIDGCMISSITEDELNELYDEFSN